MKLIEEIAGFFVEIAPFMLLGLGAAGIMHVLVSRAFVARHIGSKSFISVFKAAVFGVPLPLCSCGVIPAAAYFSKSGASKGAVVSFLVSTPQTGIDSIIATYGLLGPVFAVFRPLAALVSGVAAGITANHFDSSVEIEEEKCSGACHTEAKPKNALIRMYNYAFKEFLDDISVQFIFGVIIAGIIAVFLPADFFIENDIGGGIAGMGLMILIGIPMYVCATASIPIALALISRGISPGAAFVFLAVGPLTNAASLMVLFTVLKAKLLTVYLVSGVAFSVIFGLLLDYVFKTFDLSMPILQNTEDSNASTDYFGYIFAAVFLALLLASIFRKIRTKTKNREKK